MKLQENQKPTRRETEDLREKRRNIPYGSPASIENLLKQKIY